MKIYQTKKKGGFDFTKHPYCFHTAIDYPEIGLAPGQHESSALTLLFTQLNAHSNRQLPVLPDLPFLAISHAVLALFENYDSATRFLLAIDRFFN